MNTFFYIICVFPFFIVFCFLLFLTFSLIMKIVEDGIRSFNIKDVLLLLNSIAILLFTGYILINLEF